LLKFGLNFLGYRGRAMLNKILTPGVIEVGTATAVGPPFDNSLESTSVHLTKKCRDTR